MSPGGTKTCLPSVSFITSMATFPTPYIGTGYFSSVPTQDETARMIPKDSLRKRPKYTRSKMGCLTCRAKKVKCDEVKPVCTRCVQGQRECTWPENAPPRRKPSGRKSQEDRPSTADSEQLSSSSSPPQTREQSPGPRTSDIGLTLPARSSDPRYHMSSPSPGISNHRRLSVTSNTYLPPSHQFSPPSDALLHPIPELHHPYATHQGPVHPHSTQHMHASYYPPSSSTPIQQQPSFIRPQEPMLPPLDMSRFPPLASTQLPPWQSSAIPPLDSESYVRYPNLTGRVHPHPTAYAVPQYPGKGTDGALLYPVRVW